MQQEFSKFFLETLNLFITFAIIKKQKTKMENQTKAITLTNLESPSFLLNFPTSFSTKDKNNVWMKEDDVEPDMNVAIAQWTDLYSVLSSNGMVTLLPTPHNCDLQDLVFVANLGVVVNEDTIIISNFTSEPRHGETKVGMDYFKIAGFKNVIECPFKFEGEADLKHIKDNIWIGGYGLRSDIKAYEWMEENFDMKIIKVKMTNEKCYHFDCLCFPITSDIVMICEELLTRKEIDEIRKVANIINVPLKYAENGCTNNVRIHNFIINASDITDIDPIEFPDDYKLEREKNQFLEDIAISLGMEMVFVNLSEFTLGGAMLSCCVLHLNRFSYQIDLV